MSDVNAAIAAVDQAMDLLNQYQRELSVVCARGCFEVDSVRALVDRERKENWNRIEKLQYRDHREADGEMLKKLWRKQESLNRLYERVCCRCGEIRDSWTGSYKRYEAVIEDGKRMMGEYICKLNRIAAASGKRTADSMGPAGYFVVIVDSKTYPQTADHIRWAIKRGLPEFVTLDRKRAAGRRADSLKEKETRSEYDRDEWPMACFTEGGLGADVFYLDRSDNRGAGACIGHQLRGLPDGSRIRIRII